MTATVANPQVKGRWLHEAKGQMRNLSLIRPMSFHIAVVTGEGTYAEWYLSECRTIRICSVANAKGGT